MTEEKIGEVVKFFGKPGVVAIKVTSGELTVGNRIHIKGHTTDFEDLIESMQVDNQPVERAGPGHLVGIKVKERAREGDAVYRLTE